MNTIGNAHGSSVGVAHIVVVDAAASLRHRRTPVARCRRAAPSAAPPQLCRPAVADNNRPGISAVLLLASPRHDRPLCMLAVKTWLWCGQQPIAMGLTVWLLCRGCPTSLARIRSL